MAGRILAIHIAPTGEAPMASVPLINALAGVGLEGDRYALAQGSFSGNPGTGREVTLIEVEALRALDGELGLEIDPAILPGLIHRGGLRCDILEGGEIRVGDEVSDFI